MRVVCSYCRLEIGDKEPLDDPAVTHGMCPSCLVDFERQYEALRLGEYLDQFSVPVLAVDGEGRVVCVNQRMADLLGVPNRELVGLLGGEVMECVNAQLPQGCGKTEYCAACTVRRTVTETASTGKPQHHVPAYVEQYRQRLKLLISTEKHGDIVCLTIEGSSVAKRSR